VHKAAYKMKAARPLLSAGLKDKCGEYLQFLGRPCLSQIEIKSYLSYEPMIHLNIDK